MAPSVNIFVLIVILLNYNFVISVNQTCDSDANEADDDVRSLLSNVANIYLPDNVIPVSYKIVLIPILKDEFNVSGIVRITLNVTEQSPKLVLHKKDMEIVTKFVNLTEVGTGNTVEIVEHDVDEERDFYIIYPKEKLIADQQYLLSIPFKYVLNDKLYGFYRSSYKTADNETRWMATTQMQPVDARRAFPCFDEPALKARFQINIARSPRHTSISNMPIASTTNATELEGTLGLQGWKWDHFEESVPMSTYLVAFVVSDMKYIQSKHSLSNVDFKIWAREDALDQAHYASDIGPRCLEFYEEYFGIDYPLPKQDMAAIPDFIAGAMENWGLITYREFALLYNPNVSSVSQQKNVAHVVAHELAHQWFGNLVTPKWWTDLWLNEGFASYVQYLGVNEVEKNWKSMEQFVLFELQNALVLDSLMSSHAISILISHPDEINENFDTISYSKGAAIIRMMDHFLTTPTFKKGLHNYLTKWQFSNAEQDDLWTSLTEQAHQDRTLPPTITVKDIMDTWTLQKGFPVITVTRDYDNGTAIVTQKSISGDYQWWVPISYTFKHNTEAFDNTRPKVWMSKDEEYITISDIPVESWVIFNVNQTGYYRVNYDTTNWKLIFEALETDPSSISTINRAQIIDDAFQLAKRGLLDYEVALGAIKYLAKEKEYIPWSTTLSNLSYLKSMLIRTEAYGEFKKYMLNLLSKLYYEVGFEKQDGDDQLEIFLRKEIVGWACALELEDCIVKATALYQKWMKSPDPHNDNPIPIDLKDEVCSIAVHHGGEKEWNFAWKIYQETNFASEKSILRKTLGSSKEIWILSRYLQWVISKGRGIRLQDGASVFSNVAEKSIGQLLAFDFLREKWDDIFDNYNTFTLSEFVSSGTSGFNTQLKLKELKEFRRTNKNKLGTAKRTTDQAIEKTEENIKWMNLNYKKIYKWLKNANEEYSGNSV